jgi:lysine-N-methylase
MSTIPYRPRLAEHAMLRRHVIDGIERSYVVDLGREELLEIDDEQLTVLRACDGTRDLGGVMLAVSRHGAYRRASAVETLLGELRARGLLADGLPPPPAPEVRVHDRPLEPLPDFALACSRHGACCSIYPSLPFERDVARRALELAPAVLGGDPRRLFMPVSGSSPGERVAVTLVDGRCAFLAASGECSLQAAGGAAAKPAGCRQFPVILVDDGEAVRVSVAVECPCVLESALAGDGRGEPLVASDARVEGDLPAGHRISRLPPEIEVSVTRTDPRAALRAWSLAVLASQPTDAVAAFWALGEAASRLGLDPAAAREAAVAAAPSAAALAADFAALADKSAQKRASMSAWRSERDRSRVLLGWIDDAAQALRAPEVVAARLADTRHAAAEAFYLRALVHGYLMVTARMPFAMALRDRAVRVLLARQCAVVAAPADPAAAHPLTAVDAMMRGQGLDGYVAALAS